MKTFTNISRLLFMIVILSKCDSQNQVQEVEFKSLGDIAGNYTFQVTRISEHPAVQFPTDTITENQYNIDSSGKEYEILFSSEGNQISIQSDSIIGQISYQSSQLIKYDLVQGLFAGGRFIAWFDGLTVKAEMTVYGSGVPIILSERGKLIKKSR